MGNQKLQLPILLKFCHYIVYLTSPHRTHMVTKKDEALVTYLPEVAQEQNRDIIRTSPNWYQNQIRFTYFAHFTRP